MNSKIESLLELVRQFPVIKRLEYDDPDHRLFLNKLLTALKEAAPQLEERRAMVSVELYRSTVDSLRAELAELRKAMADRPPSIPALAPEGFPSPSSPVSLDLGQEIRRCTHNRADSPKKDGTCVASDPAPDISHKPASLPSIASAALAKSKFRPKTPSKSAEAILERSASDPLPEAPPETPATGTP